MKYNLSLTAGRLAAKAGRSEQAVKLFTQVAQRPSAARAQALYRLANLEFQQGDLADARMLLEEALELEPGQAPWHYRLATVLEKSGDVESALFHYRIAVTTDPSNVGWAQKLARCENRVRIAKAQAASEQAKILRKKGQRWQELELLMDYSPSYTSSPDWFIRLGDALEAMHRHAEAAEAFQRANVLRPGNAMLLFREGHCWRLSGEQEKAGRVFREAIQRDRTLDSTRLGVGVFYEKRGMWLEAADQFEQECQRKNWDAELLFRAGRAQERCYRWEEASEFYRQAIRIAPLIPRNHFRLGFVLEQKGDLRGAASCYAYGLDRSLSEETEAPYWAYRLGVVREQLSQENLANDAYQLSLGHVLVERDGASTTDPHKVSMNDEYEHQILKDAKTSALNSSDASRLLELAGEFEKNGSWSFAVECLNAAAARSQSFDGSIFARLGVAYRRLGDESSAAACFRRTRLSESPRNISRNDYKKDASLLRIFDYAEMREALPINEHDILYESFFGKEISCNPYALFVELYNDPAFAKYTHVWVVNAQTSIPPWMRLQPRIVFVERGTHLYDRYLATAKYLVNNSTFPPMFNRRDGQRYLNTWHGTPMKTMGRDMGTSAKALDHRNVARNLLMATHFIVPNEHTKRVLLQGYNVDGLLEARVAYTGYPRIDQTLSMNASTKLSLRMDLGVPADGKPVVLYAPTWRGDASSQRVDSERLINDLVALSSLDCHVLFRGHYMSVALLPAELPVRIVGEEINTNALLGAIDLLISDYSSIVFDFLPTRRPVICYTYDLEEYKEERGLYFAPEDHGLMQVRSTAELVQAVQACISKPEEWIPKEDIVDMFCAKEDGSSAVRVKRFFFEDDETEVLTPPPVRQRILFHHSMLPNGITSSLINLLKSLDPAKHDLTLVVPAGDVESNPESVALLRTLPRHVRILGDAGRQTVQIEEKRAVEFFNKHFKFGSSEHRDIYLRSFEREYRRLFGDSVFDVVVEFEGYSRYWTSVLAAAPNAKKIIYLHSDMESERKVRFPYLEAVFKIYREFDVLASVSPMLSVLNQETLSLEYGLDANKFVPIINQIDADGTLEGAAKEMDPDLQDWFRADKFTFITMGRLSKEKDHPKLIQAFSRIRSHGYHANLVILGDGPLRSHLHKLIEDLGLQQDVYLAGMRENPFPALKAADCFVLSSNHEGQPMVLLEALILGKQIIATDIPGSRYVLSENPNSLCDNSVEGLVAGMRSVLDQKSPVVPHFDLDKYQRMAREGFLTIAAAAR